MQRDSHRYEARKAFGLLFLTISIAIGAATILSELVFVNHKPFYYHIIILIASFGITFGVISSKLRMVISSIGNRIKNSTSWTVGAKALNGICWAVPFAAIAVFPTLYQYLILLGIGLGNFSTYLLMKKYSGLDNREQMIVGLISLFAIPLAIGFDSIFFAAQQDIALMISRVLISVAYGVGGIYAITSKG